jgi:hypothetical protein
VERHSEPTTLVVDKEEEAKVALMEDSGDMAAMAACPVARVGKENLLPKEAKEEVRHLHNKHHHPHIPPFLRVRQHISWWRQHASMEVLELILGGVEPQFPQLTFPLVPRGAPNKEQMNAALEVMEEYIKIQAARELPVTELKSTKYLVPWFVIEKHSSEGSTSVKKHRLISDCRKLNSALHPPKFRLESWKDILPHLRKGHWGVKLDIENAYFHLENSACLKPYLRMLIAGRLFQLEGGVLV